MPCGLALRVLGLRVEGSVCTGYRRGVRGCPLLAISRSLLRIPPPLLGLPPPALGISTSLGGISGSREKEARRSGVM